MQLLDIDWKRNCFRHATSPTKKLRFNSLFKSNNWVRQFAIINNTAFIRNKAIRGLGYLIETEGVIIL